MDAIVKFLPLDLPYATLIASLRPVFFCASLILCGYVFVSVNFKGSDATRLSKRFSYLSSSNNILKYSDDPILI